MKAGALFVWQRINRKLFIIGIFLGIIGASATVYIPRLIGNFLDKKFLDNLFENKLSIALVSILLIGIYFIRGLSAYLIGKTGANVMAELQKELWIKILATTPNNMENYKAGDLASRLTNDIATIVKIVTVVIPEMILNILIVVGSIVFLFLLSAKLTVVVLCVMILLFIGVIILNRILEQYYYKYQTELGNISGNLVQKIINFRIVKSFLAEDEEITSGTKTFEKNAVTMTKIARLLALQESIFSSIIMLVIIVCILIASFDISKGIMEVSILASFILYIIQIFGPLSELLESVSEFAEFQGISKRIFSIFNFENEEVSGAGKNDFKGNILFRNIDFKYGNKEVLTDLSFEILDGGKYALIGPSGSGKTTIFNIILKFNTGYNGYVSIDGIDLQTISSSDVRKNIAYIPQTSSLFAGTIRENLLYGKNANVDESKLTKVLEILQINEFLDRLPSGIETSINESGEGLSEGQKQRINIARGFLSNSPIILLDEVTSNLDVDTEKNILEAINVLGRDKTIVMIAHRRQAIESMESYIMLNETGELDSFGKTEEL